MIERFISYPHHIGRRAEQLRELIRRIEGGARILYATHDPVDAKKELGKLLTSKELAQITFEDPTK